MAEEAGVRLVSCPAAFVAVRLPGEDAETGVYLYYGPFPDLTAPRGYCQRCCVNGCAHVVAALGWADRVFTHA